MVESSINHQLLTIKWLPLGGEIESRLAYTQKSEGQNLPERPASAGRLRHGRPLLPLSMEVCTPVSETGGAGALPAAAASFKRVSRVFTPGFAVSNRPAVPPSTPAFDRFRDWRSRSKA